MMKRLGLLATVVAAVLVVALVLVVCTGDGGPDQGSGGVPSAPGPSATGTAPGGAGSIPAPPEPRPSPTPSADGGSGGQGSESEWTSGPLTVTHQPSVPPVPQLLRIRSAAHPVEGYDRIVFDFPGPLPGYTVHYVDQVRHDPSDQPVAVPGRRFLLIVFTPAQAHTDAGEVLVPPTPDSLEHPMMRGYALAGDFEGYVSVAIGLDDVVGYRVGEIAGQPGRIYLDVAA